MAAKSTTKDRVDDLLRLIHSLEDSDVYVGLPGETASRDDGVTNPTLAYIHEYGSPAQNIPARPFLVPGVQDALPKIVKVIEKGTRRVLDGQKAAVHQTLEQVGLVAQDGVQMKIVNGPFVPNSPVTIAMKKSSRPLIDTGQMRQSVRYVIRRRGS